MKDIDLKINCLITFRGKPMLEFEESGEKITLWEGDIFTAYFISRDLASKFFSRAVICFGMLGIRAVCLNRHPKHEYDFKCVSAERICSFPKKIGSLYDLCDMPAEIREGGMDKILRKMHTQTVLWRKEKTKKTPIEGTKNET